MTTQGSLEMTDTHRGVQGIVIEQEKLLRAKKNGKVAQLNERKPDMGEVGEWAEEATIEREARSTRTHTLTHSLTHTLTLSPTHTPTHSHTHTLTPSHTHTLTHAITHTLAHHILTHSHTHTHLQAHTLTLTHSL